MMDIMSNVRISRICCSKVQISDADLKDFVSLYINEKVPLTIVLADFDKNKSVRGRAASSFEGSTVHLYIESIKRSLHSKMPVGGNVSIPTTLNEAIMMVLAHELRHVYQFLTQKHNKAFWSGKYRSRPAEIDARQFVDKNEDTILAFAGTQIQPHVRRVRADINLVQEISELCEILVEAGPLTDDELREELSASGLNNPTCFAMARDMLDEMLADASVAA